MLPSVAYSQYCQQHQLCPDSSQQTVMLQFDRIYNDLQENHRRWYWPRSKKDSPVKGMYLWGGVGRGKTMLLDIFTRCLPQTMVCRKHFHQFMREIHQALRAEQKRDPLKYIAQQFADEYRVLCLDEFHINDITDAMLMGGLLAALFTAGLCLITTSNQQPQQLYQDGLQRVRFLPAIDLILQHTTVIQLDHSTDYRLLTLRKQGTYFCPLDQRAHMAMQTLFAEISNFANSTATLLDLAKRQVPVLGNADGVVWFEFAILCNTARATSDYMLLASEYHTVLVANIFQLDDSQNNAARRLLNLIDIFYEHKINLIISAAVPIEKLYVGQRLAFEFQRATSRLIEMQSEQYLAMRDVTNS